jgi:hypothetical protein
MSASAVASSLMIRYADRWGFLPLRSLDDSLVGTNTLNGSQGLGMVIDGRTFV